MNKMYHTTGRTMYRLAVLFILFGLTVSCVKKSKEVVEENEFYVCSMDPQVMEKQPGMCPICKMPLAKTVIDKTQLHLIRLNDEQQKLGNIETDTVRMGSIWEEKTVTGVFTVDQNLQQQISSRFSGRIEKLYYKIPGEEIIWGDLIYEVYSLELMQAQQEFLFSLEKEHLFPGSFAGPARNKLLLWGMTEYQVQILEKENKPMIVFPIRSKVSGTIAEIPFKEGDYIDAGSPVYKLADLNSLWVEAQVYSNETAGLMPGDKLDVIPEPFPGEPIEGEIDFVNPGLQAGTTILLVRIKVANERRKLLPGMMAFVILKSESRKAVVLPADAVIHDGRKAHAWVKNSDGSYEAREVKTGIRNRNGMEILSGLSPGEVAVTTGAYLLYSDYVFKRGAYPLTGEGAEKKHH